MWKLQASPIGLRSYRKSQRYSFQIIKTRNGYLNRNTFFYNRLAGYNMIKRDIDKLDMLNPNDQISILNIYNSIELKKIR